MFKKSQWTIAVVLIFVSNWVYSQATISGTVIDPSDNLPLPGVNLWIEGTQEGTISDANGKFELKSAKTKGTLLISYVGYETKKVNFNGSKNLGAIVLESGSEALEEATVFAGSLIDIASDRNTPVAASTISAKDIRDKSGDLVFPEVLKNTPSVYINGQAGGYGEGAVYVRGFDQTNTAFLLNGQPINAMEDGKMYWSNWQGMTEIANAVQVQRGLGSSKLAISSVGGTVNIVTRATDKKQGGFVRGTYGNNNFYKGVAGYNTGIMENGLGVSLLLTHWGGDGYNDGTRGEGQNYFLSVGYKASEKHNFNFLIFGAPQYHDQNFRTRIQTLLDNGLRYNGNWGYQNGEYKTFRRNYYHKPVANLNWEWKMGEKASLSTVLYASWGRGGGTGPRGATGNRDANNQVDFDAIVAANANVPNGIGSFDNGGGIIRSSVNNHSWYGLVTNYNIKLSDNLEFSAGLDIRSYEGTHFRQVTDLLNLSVWNEGGVRNPNTNFISATFEADPWQAVNNFASITNRLDYDNSETINYGGIFGQIEYSTELFSAFAQGAVSTQNYTRFDRYQYDEANEESETVSKEGYNVKGGAAYSFNEAHKVFANVGYYSRQPYFENIFLNFANIVNPLTENEKVTGIEVGYNFRNPIIDVNLNLYRTHWKDRVTSRQVTDNTTGAITFTNNSGVSQLHTGVEVDFNLRATSKLSFTGFASLGNWVYNDDIYNRIFNEDQVKLSEEVVDVDGSKVGNAAQTSFGAGARYYIVKGLSVDTDFRFYDNLYADAPEVKKDLKLPSFGLLDLGVNYFIPLKGKQNLGLRVNVNNALNSEYLAESSTAIFTGDNDATGKNYGGVDTANQVYFGNGTTWNVTVSYNF